MTNLLLDPAIAAIVLNVRRDHRHREARERERLIETLTFERQRLGRLLQQAPAFIAVLRGEELVFEVANDAFVELMGTSRELLGKPLRVALPDIAAQGAVEVCAEVMRTGVPWSKKAGPVTIARHGTDPERHYTKAIVEPLFENDGTVSGVFVIGVDVTEEYGAHQRVRDQFNGVPVPIYAWQRLTVDGMTDFILRDVNDAARARDGAEVQAGLGRSVRQTFPGEPQTFADLTFCLDRGQTLQREVERTTPASARSGECSSPMRRRRPTWCWRTSRTSPTSASSKPSSARRTRWRRWAGSPGASRTTSTTCSRWCSATPAWRSRSCRRRRRSATISSR